MREIRNKIFNEDCLIGMNRIPDESVDLIVTDPPYKITARGNGGNSGGMFRNKIVNSGNVFEHNTLDISDWIDEAYRVLKDNSHCYIMTNNKNIGRYLSAVENSRFQYVKNLVWVKNNKIMGQSYMSQFEYIIFLRKGKHKKINNCGTSDVLEFENNKTKDSNGKNIHDTEKPIKLMEVLIENSSDVDDVVLDMFLGAGTTAIACINTNRNYIGFEIDKGYYDIAQKRTKNLASATNTN